jgi:hypothetical protein
MTSLIILKCHHSKALNDVTQRPLTDVTQYTLNIVIA